MILQSGHGGQSRLGLKNILFLGLMFFLAGIAGAQELATNPGFETGTTTGWFAFGSPTLTVETVRVHSGSYACLVTNRTAGYMGAAQSFAGVLQSGQTYNVSAWVRLVSGASQTVYLTFQKTDGSGTTYLQAATNTATASGWTQIAGQYTLNVSGTLGSLTLYAELPNSATGAYYIDDLSVQLTNLPPPPPAFGQCSVNWNDVHQRIDGFGGGVVFLTDVSDPVSATFMNTAFGTNANQLALTLLRVRIDPTTNWVAALADAQKAVALGAGVLATPWTPPASMKSNGVLTNGSLLPSQYANYASYLNNFAGYMASNGTPLRAISVQNEPDWPATYESCVWSGTQFENFFLTNAGSFGSTPVMMPESLDYNFSYSDPTLNDPVAVTNVSLVGGHLYGVTNIQDYTNAHNKGKPTWMTEFLLNDQTITTAIATADQVHQCLTTGNMSAYIWWKAFGSANGLVDSNGVPQIRGFVLSQWSRFVRPNFYRIGVINNTNTSISAYKDTNSPNFAIVAVNTNVNISVIQTFGLTNFNATSVTPWITSGTMSLAVQSPVNLTNSSFTYTLPPLSVVTFVGQGITNPPNTPPTLAPVADQTINAGVTLVITNAATDTNPPPQTLTFSLLSAPTNATLTPLNNTNAVFTWRPLVSQANTTNPITVQVVDSASLSATNNFNVIVNPLAQPTVSSINVAGGQVNLVATGAVGPDYTLWASTNLMSWQVLFTSNSPVTPVTLVDTNFNANPVRFYRIQLGP
jgi:glucuronoarabinoxylan endo-1,4-beta-xylanase